MVREFSIKKPFFEFGPKLYLYGDDVLVYAKYADALVKRYGVDIIFSAQPTDIERIVKNTKHLKVFAQHMDPFLPERGIGGISAEALSTAGAHGVLLNHAERPMSVMDLSRAIRRADELGLATLVCAGDEDESRAVACLKPNIVLAESPELIGKGQRNQDSGKEIQRINRAVEEIDPNILVLHGAGIKDETDVYDIIRSGADATGSTSGIIKAENPLDMFTKMINAVSRGYKDRMSKGA